MAAWLAGLDGGRGTLRRYRSALCREFTALSMLRAAVLPLPIGSDLIERIDPVIWSTLGVDDAVHRRLLAQGITALDASAQAQFNAAAVGVWAPPPRPPQPQPRRPLPPSMSPPPHVRAVAPWPHPGKDIVALQVGPPENTVLAVMCRGCDVQRMAVLSSGWQQCVLSLLLSHGAVNECESDDAAAIAKRQRVGAALTELGGEWAATHFGVFLEPGRRGAVRWGGRTAVGVGRTKKVRHRAGNLALAVQLAIDHRMAVRPEVRPVLTLATYALQRNS